MSGNGQHSTESLLHDTSRCPCGRRCESCGREGTAHTVRTFQAGMGVLCLTLCPRCAKTTTAPPVSVSTAARLVIEHAMHLGLTLEQVAELIREAREDS